MILSREVLSCGGSNSAFRHLSLYEHMEVVRDKKPHVLAVPFPAQGHVNSLMKLSHQIAKHGIKVTFVNIECIHEKVVAATKISGKEDEAEDNKVQTTSIPGPEDTDVSKLVETLRSTMPESLTDLIERINSSNPDEKISCVIADVAIGWILETAQKMGAQSIAFSAVSAAAMAIALQVPKLLEEGILDPNGSIKKGEIISLSDDIPAWGKDELPWSFASELKAQKTFFENAPRVEKTVNQVKWVLINTCYELESPACDLNPKLVPIGPLLQTSSPKSCSNSSNFYPEDASCLRWLDNKPAGSVIYVSFGSIAIFSQQQLDELALGLELSGRAFLWVVRSDLANGSRAVYPNGFLERVSKLGKIVEWAPQEKVLSHPSIACFLSHCGWNSTLEGSSKGVPFLCWPYFADQFHNQSYICDKWEIGLRINPDENGIRSRHEIKKKIDMLFSNDNLKANALRLMETSAVSIGEGGSSYKNLKTFIDHLRK